MLFSARARARTRGRNGSHLEKVNRTLNINRAAAAATSQNSTRERGYDRCLWMPTSIVTATTAAPRPPSALRLMRLSLTTVVVSVRRVAPHRVGSSPRNRLQTSQHRPYLPRTRKKACSFQQVIPFVRRGGSLYFFLRISITPPLALPPAQHSAAQRFLSLSPLHLAWFSVSS